MADLVTSDSRVGPAIGLTRVDRSGTGAPQPTGGGTLERYNGANFNI